MSDHEIAIMEAERNHAEDEYFKARPQIDTGHCRHLFNAGFERAWQAACAQGDAEPVAYISHTSESSCLDWFAQFDAPRHMPLYTHPPKAQAVPESIEAAIYMLEDYASALENGDLDGAGHSTTSCIHEVIDQLATAPQPPQEGKGDA